MGLSLGAIATLGSLALAGAGTGMQMTGNAEAQSAENDATNAELLRQKQYQDQGQSLFKQSLGQSGVETAQKQIATGAVGRQEAMTKQAAIPLTTSQASSPVATQSANVVTPKLAQSGAAEAKLGGYSDWDLQQWIKNLRAQQNLAINSQFAQSSDRVLPYELQSASRAGDTMRSIGGALGGLGGLVGTAGKLYVPTSLAGSSWNMTNTPGIGSSEPIPDVGTGDFFPLM